MSGAIPGASPGFLSPWRSEPEPRGSGDDGLDPRFAWVPGFREAVEEEALARREGGGGVERVQPSEREGRAGTVADETLDTRPVVGLDTHGGFELAYVIGGQLGAS